MGDITSPSLQICRGPMAITTKHVIPITVINYEQAPRGLCPKLQILTEDELLYDSTRKNEL